VWLTLYREFELTISIQSTKVWLNNYLHWMSLNWHFCIPTIASPQKCDSTSISVVSWVWIDISVFLPLSSQLQKCDSTIISVVSWVWIDISGFLPLLVYKSVTRQLSASYREFELTFLDSYHCSLQKCDSTIISVVSWVWIDISGFLPL
jgi:hypothetical protein